MNIPCQFKWHQAIFPMPGNAFPTLRILLLKIKHLPGPAPADYHGKPRHIRYVFILARMAPRIQHFHIGGGNQLRWKCIFIFLEYGVRCFKLLETHTRGWLGNQNSLSSLFALHNCIGCCGVLPISSKNPEAMTHRAFPSWPVSQSCNQALREPLERL